MVDRVSLLSGLAVPRILECAASASPQRIAATLGESELTYKQCSTSAAKIAHALSDWGVKRGDRILYWSDISLDAISLYFALSYLGAVFVPANPAFSEAEIDAVAKYLRPAFIICDSAHQEPAQQLARDLAIGLAVLNGQGRTVAGYDLGGAVLQASDKPPRMVAAGCDPNIFYLTSGSTGTPKAVIISHQAQYLRAGGSQAYDAVCGGRGAVCMFPLFHMAGWYMILQAFGRRRTVHLTKKASAAELWSIVETHQPHELYCIPAVWHRMLDEAQGRNGSCINFALTGTSRVELDLLEAIRGRFPNARNGIYYGSTEMGVSLGISHDDIPLHPYSVGIPMPNVETRVVDGELWLRADTAMDGYFGLPDQTAEVMEGGWYRSGDLVSRNSDGFFEIVGRRREIIRSGGETISPAEVEAAISEMPGVQEAAVVGLPHEAWGEIVCAVIVAKFGHDSLSVDTVRAFLDGRLAAFKHPRIVCVLHDMLPRTSATGQIQRSRILTELIAETEASASHA